MIKKTVIDFLLNAGMWLWVYFSPTFSVILIIGFFVVCDMITGIVAARKIGEPITSKRLRETIGKFLSYGIAILVAHVIEQQFIHDFPALKAISGFLVYIELKSMNENFEKITGHNIFNTVLEKLKVK